MSVARRQPITASLPPVPIRVLLAADLAFWRAGLRRLLSTDGFDVVGVATGVDDALDTVARTRPDVVVVAFDPGTIEERHHNVQVARTFRSRFPDMGLVMLAREVRAATALELFGPDAGGIGYLLTDRVEDVGVLAEVVRDAAAGRSAVDGAVVEELLRRARRSGHPLLELTPRERQVLALMAEGRSNAGIARRLFITEHTVEKHVRSVLAKLGIPTKADDHRRVLAVLAYLQES